eukprot:m.226761 g.226761  ORF g.226761 m.226761 type:complete len:1258 (-) comp26405_c0_seq3:76-3849(-)
MSQDRKPSATSGFSALQGKPLVVGSAPAGYPVPVYADRTSYRPHHKKQNGSTSSEEDFENHTLAEEDDPFAFIESEEEEHGKEDLPSPNRTTTTARRTSAPAPIHHHHDRSPDHSRGEPTTRRYRGSLSSNTSSNSSTDPPVHAPKSKPSLPRQSIRSEVQTTRKLSAHSNLPLTKPPFHHQYHHQVSPQRSPQSQSQPQPQSQSQSQSPQHQHQPQRRQRQSSSQKPPFSPTPIDVLPTSAVKRRSSPLSPTPPSSSASPPARIPKHTPSPTSSSFSPLRQSSKSPTSPSPLLSSPASPPPSSYVIPRRKSEPAVRRPRPDFSSSTSPTSSSSHALRSPNRSAGSPPKRINKPPIRTTVESTSGSLDDISPRAHSSLQDLRNTTPRRSHSHDTSKSTSNIATSTAGGRQHSLRDHQAPSRWPSRMSPEDALSRRRTVSDAAQWLRQKRKADLQKELLPAGTDGAPKHRFEWQALNKPAFCGVCAKLFWGFSRQLKCSECGFETHKACQVFAPACLGHHGSIASLDTQPVDPSLETKLMRVCVSSAENLARRNVFRAPDPFAIVTVDGEQFQTSMARKTLNPQWDTERDIFLSSGSTITVHVFDGKKFRQGQMTGFLGMAVIPASAFMDQSSLGDGATTVITFRLKKRVPDDHVTGTVMLRVRALDPAKLKLKSSPAPIPSREFARSPSLLPAELPSSPFKSLIPPQLHPPLCELVKGDETAVHVQWDLGEVRSKGSGITYTLSIITEDEPEPHDIYSGEKAEHIAVGLKPGCAVRFVVKASNFYGSGPFSLPSESITLTERAPEHAERKHCPMFMAGVCFRGRDCPFSHGAGLQSADDVSAALFAVGLVNDPDLQMAAAIAASLTDYTRDEFDPSLLPQYKRAFHEKSQNFRSKVQPQPGACSFTVSRADLFRSSFFEVVQRKPADLKKKLEVKFLGEGGLDFGGLAREWFYLISHDVFHPSYGMFTYARDDDYSLQISPTSAADADHLLYFQFVGRIFGMAILHNHFLDVTFTIAFYKMILGEPITLRDLQVVDPQMHRSLLWMLENDVEDMDMYFTVDYDDFGAMVTHELIPDGSNVQVIEENKQEFVKLMIEWKLYRSTERQMNAFIRGFHEIIPRAEILRFNPRELELLVCGTPTFDLADWRGHTMYEGGYSESSSVIKWLWETVEEFSPAQQAKFLQFCTGSTRVPVEGFQTLQGSDGPRKFCVQRIADLSRLPSAHTCFNRLDLPAFEDKATLRTRLLLAMEGAQGFTGD